MIYRTYGSTGKQVSVIGFGGMRFLPEEYKKGFGKPAELVLRAKELGVNYFDTAPGYCDDQSELIFGEAFRQMEGTFYVSTKCGLWTARTADEARRLVEQSVKRLHVPRITFYHLWCIKSLDEYNEMTKKGGIYEGIKKAQEDGLIEHICCSTHAAGEEIQTIVEDGLVEGVTLGYNAINFAYRRAGLSACHRKKLGVVTMNPLGGGVIPANPEMFSFIRQPEDASLAVAALRFIIGQPEVTVALPGISNLEELTECVSACEHVLPITPEKLSEMSAHLFSELNSLCTGCGYCEGCPVGIAIPKMMDAYNEVLINKKKDGQAAFERLRMHWGMDAQTAQDCIACGQCEQQCTQKLPIIERLAQLAQWARG